MRDTTTPALSHKHARTQRNEDTIFDTHVDTQTDTQTNTHTCTYTHTHTPAHIPALQTITRCIHPQSRSLRKEQIASRSPEPDDHGFSLAGVTFGPLWWGAGFESASPHAERMKFYKCNGLPGSIG